MALKVVVEGYMAAPMVKDKLRNSERPCRRFWTTVQALKWPATSTKDIGRVGEWTGQVTVNEREGASELLGSHLTASHIHPQLPSGVEEWTGRATMIEHEGASELPGSHLTASHIHPQLPDGVEEWTGQVTMNEREDASELLGSHLTASHIHPQLPGDSSRRRSGHSMKERFTRNDGQWRAPRPVSSIIHGSDPIVKPLQQAHSSQEPLCSAPWRGP